MKIVIKQNYSYCITAPVTSCAFLPSKRNAHDYGTISRAKRIAASSGMVGLSVKMIAHNGHRWEEFNV